MPLTRDQEKKNTSSTYT